MPEPSSREFDVAVIRGGTAGLTAALAAAHEGARVALVERDGRIGVAPTTLVIRTADGPTRRVLVPFVTVHSSTLFAAFLLDPADAASEGPPEAEPEPHRHLTPRQLTVLTMLADGKQARVIAEELHLSELTVRNHIRAILRELGCSSQLAAVAEAIRLRLLDRR